MKLSLYDHLKELRNRLLLIIIFLLAFFVIGFLASDFLIKRVLMDLIFVENVKIVGLTPVEYILTKLKLSLVVSLILTIPVIIYQGLVFVRPGLNKRERNAIIFILPAFILLLLTGIVFAYYIFLPVSVYFLANLSKGIIENIWSIGRFFNFVLLICFSFAFIFQLPLLLLVFNKLNIMNVRKLKRYRAYVYVLIFLVAALITPPDVVTQLIIALPLILVYEISLALMG